VTYRARRRDQAGPVPPQDDRQDGAHTGTVPVEDGSCQSDTSLGNLGLELPIYVSLSAAGRLRHLAHGGMGRVFANAYAPSTLGSFLRMFTFGHVRQLDALASRFLLALSRLVGPGRASSPAGDVAADTGGYALLDLDDTIIDVYGPCQAGCRVSDTPGSVAGTRSLPR